MKEYKSIIFVINCLGGEGSGGSDRVISVLANEFVKEGKEVKIIALTDCEDIDRVLDERINCYFLPKLPKTKFYKVRKSFVILKTLRKNLKASPGSTVIAFIAWVNVFTIIASRFLRCKVIVSERTDPRLSMKHGLTRKLRDILYNAADYVVFQTEEAKKLFSPKIQKVSKVIPNPILANLPVKTDSEREKEIINFCRLETQKNLPMLIDAFGLLHKSYSDYRLTIYGRGVLMEELQEYIKTKGLSDCAVIKDFDSNIHSKIINSTLFASSSSYEGISNSMLEAMALGLPVVCTDCPIGGAKAFIKQYYNGILVPVNDIVAMYKAMKEVLDNESLAREMSINAMKIRDQLSVKEIYKQWLVIV